MIIYLIVLMCVILGLGWSLTAPRATLRTGRLNIRIRMTSHDRQDDVVDLIQARDYKGAYSLLKKNPMTSLTLEDGQALLNNIDALSPMSGDIDRDSRHVIEASAYIYRRLERQKCLRGFGCVGGVYPEKAKEISPVKLEKITGLNVEAFTPRQRTTYWRLAGIGLCIAQILFGEGLGMNPLITTVPGTLALLLGDQLILRGAVFETIYQKLFPEYREKIIHHEAGHFFISYLLGVPIRGCVTNAWEARKYSDIRGQAGTIFYDSHLADELNQNKVTRSSLDRMTVVLMAGIAAEALQFGRAEGGAADEQTLIGFFSSIQPPWNILRVQGQARWGVLQAILLIREHQSAFDALVDALREGKGIGDCVSTIERNLPAILPSAQRRDELELGRRRRDTELLMRYVQKMTYSVGGVDEDSDQDGVESDGVDSLGPGDAGSAADSDAALDVFTAKIRSLSKAVQSGMVNVNLNNSTGGGIWLNNLSSRGENRKEDSKEDSGSVSGVSLRIAEGKEDRRRVQPMQGYEESVRDTLIAEGVAESCSDAKGDEKEDEGDEAMSDYLARTQVGVQLSGEIPGADAVDEVDKYAGHRRDERPMSLLTSNRGYMMKKTVLVERAQKQRTRSLEVRLVELRDEIRHRGGS